MSLSLGVIGLVSTSKCDILTDVRELLQANTQEERVHQQRLHVPIAMLASIHPQMGAHHAARAKLPPGTCATRALS